jgi:hypothetical protein
MENIAKNYKEKSCWTDEDIFSFSLEFCGDVKDDMNILNAEILWLEPLNQTNPPTLTFKYNRYINNLFSYCVIQYKDLIHDPFLEKPLSLEEYKQKIFGDQPISVETQNNINNEIEDRLILI